jgi:formate dehydrogenase subunit delta
MNADNLIVMANQIGDFFETMPNRRDAVTDVAGHLKRYWEPRMRRSLLAHIDQHGGGQLHAIVLEAVRTHPIL